MRIVKNRDLERDALAALSLEEPMALVRHFATLKRESGTDDERAAALYIADRLRALGVPFTMHEPELFLSIPERSELTLVGDDGSADEQFDSRPPAFSRSTSGEVVRGELCYVPSHYAGGTADLFDTPAAALPSETPYNDRVRGKVVLTEGYSMPGTVHAFERRGAIAQIFIHPGERIHEGICTPIWGTPVPDSLSHKPRTPVVSITNAAGRRLARLATDATRHVAVRTWLREGWRPCLLPVAEIRGSEDPDEFLLVHGHYDSWYAGIGDNATGDAALLELTRVLHHLQPRLKRSVRVAWWPAHSTGRYAGSTWYADRFADEIDEWCIAHLNVDSPGCAGATAYEEVMWMAEATELCIDAIADAVGESSRGLRPLRAGDYSFNQIGPTGFYMLLSNIPQEERKARGFYAVGGCGGNTAWHTPDDLLPVADPTILERDLRVYLTTILRVLNAPLYPFDYAGTVLEIASAVQSYHHAAVREIDLEPVLDDLRGLRAAILAWRIEAERRMEADPADVDERRRLNGVLRRLARTLVWINYARGERFDHDPAIKLPAVPRLEASALIAGVSDEMRPFVRAGLVRERNKIRAAIRQARREIQ